MLTSTHCCFGCSSGFQLQKKRADVRRLLVLNPVVPCTLAEIRVWSRHANLAACKYSSVATRSVHVIIIQPQYCVETVFIQLWMLCMFCVIVLDKLYVYRFLEHRMRVFYNQLCRFKLLLVPSICLLLRIHWCIPCSYIWAHHVVDA